VRLREIHEAIDYAVLEAYGWDLDPQIGHHRTKIGTRWTVSPEARFELLDLLLDWAPDDATRRRILVDNPAALYGFA
jgi:predicted TIM-barrel fold metal-dependent hydrolase